MNSMESPKRLEVNPQTRRHFRRGEWRGIYLPALLGLLILGAVIALLWRNGVGTASAWADTAVSFLLLPFLLIGLAFALLLALLTYGVARLIGWIPPQTFQVQQVLFRVGLVARRGSDLAARPFIVLSAINRAVRRAVDRLASIFRSP
jgi:hypothetical protein